MLRPKQVQTVEYIFCAAFTVVVGGIVLYYVQHPAPRELSGTATVEVPVEFPYLADAECIEPDPPVVCPVCPEPPDPGFLARFVARLDELADQPREIRDVINRAYGESRFTPTQVIDDWYGICGIDASAHPEVDVERLLIDPEYAAEQCLAMYRLYRRKCGEDWLCCYKAGHSGCLSARSAAGAGSF